MTTSALALAQSAALVVPTVPGTPFGGGFYAGRFLLNDQVFALVVAPKAEGESVLPWKTLTTGSDGARSLRDGLANSETMNNDKHPAARFCRAVRSDGLDDWYLPSRQEAALLAEVFMPDAGYVPAQTTAEAFKTGGPEAFAQEWYWTSTEFSVGYAWAQVFYGGTQGNLIKTNYWRCRAVRKVLI